MKTKIPVYRKNLIKILTGFFVLFPWITYVKIMEYNDAEKVIFSNQQGFTLDFFLYYKEIILLWMVVIALIWYFGERVMTVKKDNNIPLIKGDNKWLFLTAGIFSVFAVISTVFSEQKKNAFWGSPTEGEGLWVLLAYVVLILAFYNYFVSEYALALIKKAITVLAVITVVLTVVEAFYKPLLEIELVRDLISPSEYAQLMASVEGSVFSNSVSLTHYNPGYYGGFVCLLLPFIMTFCFEAKKIVDKLLLAALAVGLMFGVVMANTTTSLYLAMLEVVLVVVIWMWTSKDKKSVLIQGGGLAVGMLVAAVVFGAITGNAFTDILTNANSATGKEVRERYVIKEIKLKENTVVLTGEENTLVIIHEGGILSFTDETGKEISVLHDKGKYDILEDEYEYIDIYIAYSDSLETNPAAKIFVDAGYDNTIDFLILRDGSFVGAGINDNSITDIYGNDVPESLKKYYGIFTGRGYAWINSMPILKETILVGKGPGNFAFNFKQNDYVGLLETHANAKSIIDKPHNAYLQYAIHVGVPGMLAFFGLMLIACVKGVLGFKNQKEDVHNSLHIGALVAIAGFLIYSIINDSIITVTPTACMIVGLLLATTYTKTNN